MKILKLMNILITNILFKIIMFIILFLIFMQAISYYDIRDVTNKKQLHTDFSIAVFNEDGTFYQLPLANLNKFTANKTSFMSKNNNGKKKLNEIITFSYRVIKREGNEQLIETRLKDDDRTIWSTYKATQNKIEPIKSRIYAFDFMPMAVILSLLVIVIIEFTLKVLNRLFKSTCSQ